jgi:hypothetical protein
LFIIFFKNSTGLVSWALGSNGKLFSARGKKKVDHTAVGSTDLAQMEFGSKLHALYSHLNVDLQQKIFMHSAKNNFVLASTAAFVKYLKFEV